MGAGTQRRSARRSTCATSRCTRGPAARSATLAGILLGARRGTVAGALACVDRDRALAPAAALVVASRRSGGAVARADRWSVAAGSRRGWPVPVSAVFLGAGACAAAALIAPRLVSWYRRATVASRMLALFMAFLLPALLVYPSVHYFSERSMRHLVETRYAVEAMRHPQTLQDRLRQALAEIDAVSGLPDFVAGASQAAAEAQRPLTDTAFRLWSQTVLARERLTSDLEIYNEAGVLVSPFKLSFPEYTEAHNQPRHSAAATGKSSGRRCHSPVPRNGRRYTRSAPSA